MEKNYKKELLREIKRVKTGVSSLHRDFDALQLYLSQQPLYKRILTRYDSKGEMTVLYGDMTLTFYLKSGNIIVGDIFQLWDVSGTGFVGSFTAKTLQMEGSGELD